MDSAHLSQSVNFCMLKKLASTLGIIFSLEARRGGLLLLVTIFFVGVGSTIYGFSELLSGAIAQSGWRPTHQYLIIFCFLWGVVAALSRALAIDPLYAAAIGVLSVACIAGVTLALGAALYLAAAAYALGRIVAGRSSGGVGDFLVTGGVLIGTVIGVIAHFPAATSGFYSVLLLIPVLLARFRLFEFIKHSYLDFRRAQSIEGYEFVVKSAVGAVILVHFLVALMPEIGHDALSTHLFVPAQVQARGKWGFDVSLYAGAVIPMLVNWLYTIGYVFAGELGSRVLNFGGFTLACHLVYRLAIWSKATPNSAMFGVLLFATTPLTFTETSSLFIEGFWTVFFLCGLLAVLRIAVGEFGSKRLVLVASIALAGAVASKAVTFTFLPAVGLCFLLSLKRWLTVLSAKHVFFGLVVFAALGSVPYLTAYLISGNPVFPFYNAAFKSDFFPAENFSPPAIFERGVQFNTLYKMTFQSGKYLEATPGAAGFQWLLLVLPAVVLVVLRRNWRALTIFLVAGISLALTYHQTAYLRYVFPAFAMVCAAVAAAGGSLFVQTAPLRVFVVSVAASAIVLNMLHFNSGTHYGRLKFDVLLKPAARQQYILNELPIRRAVTLVNELNVLTQPVAFFSPPLAAGLVADALYANWYNYRFNEKVRSASSPSQFGKVLSGYDVKYLIVDDGWGDAPTRQMIIGATTEIARLGGVSVRRLTDSLRFSEEQVADRRIQEGTKWQLAPGAAFVSGGGVRVTVDSPAYYEVLVEAGRRYLYVASVRCDNVPTVGRLQVNWFDKKGQFIDTSIELFGCEDKISDSSFEVRAPQRAARALIYASAHTKDPIVFEKISFIK